MLTSNLKRKVVRSVAGFTAVGLALGGSIIGTGSPAGADPKQFTAMVGVGSDTVQDVMNALSGFSNGISYTPIQSSAASGSRQVTSWDATGSNCITPKAPGGTTNRPNGSTAGRRALSRAIDGTAYGDGNCGTAKPVSGLIDFARSSAGPTAGDTGTALTYLAFGRDGVGFAYYANGVATPVTSLTRAQLTTLFTTGPQTIGGVNVIPCGIQTSSGTYAFWNTVTTANATQENAATTTCNAAGSGTRLEENDATGLKAKGDAQVGSEVIVGFSAAQFIAQSNGRSVSHLAAGVDLGSVSDNGSGTNLGKPYSGTAPSLAPVAAFYNDAVFGRNVYVVVDTAKATGVGNNDFKTLFVGSTSAICSASAQATVNLFGFLSLGGTCGATGTTGSLITGVF